MVGRGGGPQELSDALEAILARTLTAVWRPPSEDLATELGFSLRPVARLGEPGPGLLLAPFGQAVLELPLGEWLLELGSTVTLQAILLSPTGAQVVSGGGATTGQFVLTTKLERMAAEGPALLVGSAANRMGCCAASAGVSTFLRIESSVVSHIHEQF